MMGSRCQDCGNQAKKDCLYMRCRTCCKNKGFHCQTHVKSTWIPAYRRRQRSHNNNNLAVLASASVPPPIQQQNPKRVRENLLTGIEEVGNFPAQVNSTATFRCFRVSSIDEADDQLAYQTSVSIGGHVFRGILYDQGPDQQLNTSNNNNPTNNAGALTTITTANLAAASTSSLAPDNSYPFPLNAFMSGKIKDSGKTHLCNPLLHQ